MIKTNSCSRRQFIGGARAATAPGAGRSGFLLRTSALYVAVVTGLLLAALQAGRASEKSDQPVAPITAGQRMFTCAHSFHAFVYRIVGEMAKAAGIKDHQSVGLSGIGGSRVFQHWDVAEEKNQCKAALSAGKVDVLTLSPIWLPDVGIEKFAKLGLDHNPNFRVTVQEFWLPNDEYVPVYPLQVRKTPKVDHDATDLAELRKAQARYDHDMDEYCRDINKRLGKDVIVTVPVGQAAVALREKIVAGQAPGLKKQWDLFRDPWGHPQAPLQVLDGYCHFAVIYRRSPVGLPVAGDLAKMKDLSEDEKGKLNRLLQELAWDAVCHHPMGGVGAPAAESPASPPAKSPGQPASVLPNLNQLTDAEKSAGWKLLFDGTTTTGWRNFGKETISQGWRVMDGALCRVDKTAGDIITTEEFDNFIFELDYKVPPHANSGIMPRVSEDEKRAPFTGIEYQLLDNTDPKGDPQKSGWAYALYQPPLDPQTGKPQDATKPVGEWNHVKIIYRGPHVEHWMNGVKYCEFEIGSDDFNQRVAASKFVKWPKFAKNSKGHIALQGDHGDICFANIKLLPLPAK